MLIQCKYCGSNYSDTLLECPNCGAANDCVNRTAAGAPKTIEELLDWAGQHHLPLEQMRTYIGQDISSARAYGIYQDPASGDFVVYKNKSDGTRAERYRGKDEAYAVNELYQKIRTRVTEQKAHQTQRHGDIGARRPENRRETGNPQEYQTPARNRKKSKLHKIIWMVVIWGIISQLVLPLLVLFLFSGTHDKLPYASSGYYRYGSDMYYHDYGDDWYIWDDHRDTWSGYDADSDWELFEDYNNYLEGYSYDEEYGASDWGEWYDDTYDNESCDNDYDNDYDSDWDSDYDWDSGSDWDSGWDDWDSDW